MISQTYGDVKATLARTAGTTGMPVTNPQLMTMFNEATQELMNEGDWPGVVDRWHLVSTSGRTVLPPELDRLMDFTAGGVPLQIMSPWAEFVDYGPGPREDLLPNCRTWCSCGDGNVYDRGETPTVTEIPVSDGSASATIGPWLIRQYANPQTAETPGAYSTIQGLDPSGLLVRSQVDGVWINGVRLGITSGSGFTETTQEFSSITAYTKPPTNSYVRITAWNGTDEIELSNYRPNETTPSYHRYFSPYLNSLGSTSCEGTRVILARCRRRFVPVTEDTDVIIIGNVLALKAMMIAQWKRDAMALDEYAVMKVTAVDLMKKEALAYRGKTRIPAMTFQKGFSLGELPHVR